MNVIVKNTSPKIINIGKVALLPDETLSVSQAVSNAPAIKAMISRGQLSIENNKEERSKAAAEAKAAEEAARAEAEAKEKAAAEEAERKAKEEAERRAAEEAAAKPGESGDITGEGKKPLSRMNKEELLAECKRFGIEVDPDDTNPDLVKKIKAVTAE